eukprot:3607383-Rhodomonas_salina.1
MPYAAIVLCIGPVISSTDIAYAHSRCEWAYSTGVAYAAIVLRFRYTLSVTGIAVQSCYAFATRCPVLTYAHVTRRRLGRGGWRPLIRWANGGTDISVGGTGTDVRPSWAYRGTERGRTGSGGRAGGGACSRGG